MAYNGTEPEIGSSTDKINFWYSNYDYNKLYAESYNVGSDSTLKENINDINFDSRNIILSLKGKIYNFKKDSLKDKHIGFMAQDIQNLIPEAVSTSAHGDLCIDYSAIIVVMADAIKAQQNQIETLLQDVDKCCNKNTDKSLDINNNGGGKQESIGNMQFANGNGGSYLMQNRPNPFSRETVIDYFIASDVTNASIMIFDLNGKLLKTIFVNTNGKGSVTVNSNELMPGMYLYSLVINGNEVDTKKMILSE